MSIIKIKRGLDTNLPIGLEGEPLFTTDTHRLFIGDGTVNHEFQKLIDPKALSVSNDINLTLSLGGTPGTALLQPVSLTLGWTGTLADSRIASAATWNAKIGGSGITNELAYFSGTNTISSLTTATYPSLTELSYVKGVTSSIQTQLNSKGSGTVTSVAALTLGTTGTDVSSTVANPTTTPVITLNIPTASATNRGALSSTDWITFNNKFTLPAFTSGSVLFSNGTTIAQNNSQLFWDNTNFRLGIKTNSPGYALDVRALARIDGGIVSTGSDLNLSTTGTNAVLLSTNNLERLRVHSSTGNILIGTSTNSGYRLDVRGGTAFFEQNVFLNANLAIGTTSVNASALVDLVSTTRGFLFPRMTTSNWDAIASKAQGLSAFDTTQQKPVFVGTASGISQWTDTTIFSQTNTVTITNTVTETSALGTGVGTKTLPANFLAIGKCVRVTIKGYMNETSNPTIRIRLKFGATTIYDSGAVTISSLGGTNKYFDAIYDIDCRTLGATGTVLPQGRWMYTANSGVASVIDGAVTAPVTVDTTVSSALDLTVQWGTASTSNNINITNAKIQILT